MLKLPSIFLVYFLAHFLPFTPSASATTWDQDSTQFNKVAVVTLGGEGPCSNTWAQGNPASYVYFSWRAPGFGGTARYLDGNIGTDLFPPSVNPIWESGVRHFFSGESNIIVYPITYPRTWPPTEFILYARGNMTYNLCGAGVPQEVRMSGLDQITGKNYMLKQFGNTIFIVGSTYSYVRCELWLEK